MTRSAVAPRWQTPLDPAQVYGSWGPDVAAYATRVMGIRLDAWQRYALNRALAYGPDGRLLRNRVLISVGRQNGKTALVRALIGWALTSRSGPQWRTILGLAHDARQARIPYLAVLDDLQPIARRLGPPARGGLALTRYLGIRSGMYGRQRTFETGTSEARNAVRGMTVDLAIFDEVRTQIDRDTWAALEPTTTTSPDPLIVAISTAGNERSLLLRELFDRGRAIIDGSAPALGFAMTWYAAPDELEPDDPRAWAAANPAYAEHRLPGSAIRESLASLGPEAFRNERLNLWSSGTDEWLLAGTWARTERPAPSSSPRTILGVEVTPSWSRATITVARRTDDGAHVGIARELEAHAAGRATLSPTELTEALEAARQELAPAAIAYLASSAAGPYVASWAAAVELETIELGARERAAASELFRAELQGGRLTHGAEPVFVWQNRAARPSGPLEAGDWYLSVRTSLGDIDAIRAAAWAAWAAIAPPESERGPQIYFPE